MSVTETTLRDGLYFILENYVASKSDYQLKIEIRNIFDLLGQQMSLIAHENGFSNIKVKYGLGIGRMADIPWISLLNTTVTSTTQKGIYCVYAFKSDMSGVYITLNQGIGLGAVSGPSQSTLDSLHQNAIRIRPQLSTLSGFGYSLDDEIHLAEKGTGKKYEKSTIAYKLYEKNSIPSDDTLSTDLVNILKAYEDLIAEKSCRYWIFQANPDFYALERALHDLPEMSWLVNQYSDAIHKGDKVFLWQSGPEAGVKAIATILTDPADLPMPDKEIPFILAPEKFEGIKRRVLVHLDRVLDKPVLRSMLISHPLLSDLGILKFSNASNFSVSNQMAEALMSLINEQDSDLPIVKDKPVATLSSEYNGPETDTSLIYSYDNLIRDTGFSKEEVNSWINRLERKKSVIFQGPPGTGKTYVAELLAKFFVSNTGYTETIQFHPSYGYEDFMQGIKPKTVEGGLGLKFEIEDGRFVNFCKVVEQTRKKSRNVLIIDEINRANLSRVFGELMYLLEYRDKEIPLAGSGEYFHIPDNVYVIGTMNTADRSIALIDYALRRRFSFIRLAPNYDVLKKHLEARGYSADALIGVLREVNLAIADQNYELGISFFMRSDANLQAYICDIRVCEIEPYLEEYFFDHPEKVDLFRWKVLVNNQLKDWVAK